MRDPFDTVSIDEASAMLGIPRPQLARWCADGTFTRAVYSGYPGRWESLRFRRDWVMRQAAELREVEAA